MSLAHHCRQMSSELVLGCEFGYAESEFTVQNLEVVRLEVESEKTERIGTMLFTLTLPCKPPSKAESCFENLNKSFVDA